MISMPQENAVFVFKFRLFVMLSKIYLSVLVFALVLGTIRGTRCSVLLTWWLLCNVLILSYQ